MRDSTDDFCTRNLEIAQKGEAREKIVIIIQYENRFKVFQAKSRFFFFFLDR